MGLRCYAIRLHSLTFKLMYLTLTPGKIRMCVVGQYVNMF